MRDLFRRLYDLVPSWHELSMFEPIVGINNSRSNIWGNTRNLHIQSSKIGVLTHIRKEMKEEKRTPYAGLHGIDELLNGLSVHIFKVEQLPANSFRILLKIKSGNQDEQLWTTGQCHVQPKKIVQSSGFQRVAQSLQILFSLSDNSLDNLTSLINGHWLKALPEWHGQDGTIIKCVNNRPHQGEFMFNPSSYLRGPV